MSQLTPAALYEISQAAQAELQRKSRERDAQHNAKLSRIIAAFPQLFDGQLPAIEAAARAGQLSYDIVIDETSEVYPVYVEFERYLAALGFVTSSRRTATTYSTFGRTTPGFATIKISWTPAPAPATAARYPSPPAGPGLPTTYHGVSGE